jgi:hypothetical protein
MIRYVYLDPKLNKQISSLRESGKKAALVAKKVELMLSRIRTGVLAPEEVGKPTRYGEYRLRGCLKYDLGSGYRLVTLRRGVDLFVLFVGSHDDCHRWIENNRELALFDIRQRSQRYLIRPVNGNGHTDSMKHQDFVRKENDDLETELDDRQLRILFRGLIQSVQNSMSS